MSVALQRFWWVVGFGGAVGMALAVWMIYEIPEFKPRVQPVYNAAARLFVTSAEGQYIRLSVPVESARVSGDAAGEGGSGGAGGRPVVLDQTPDVRPLLAAANLYPLLIESDHVARLREKMFGQLPGTVSAFAYSAVNTPNRFTPAQVPVVDIVAESGSKQQAIALADATVKAFKVWIKKEQSRAKLTPEERILIQELRAPRQAYVSGGPSYGIPILVALAVIAAFGMLAVLLDQLIPRAAQAPQVQPVEETPTTSSQRRA